MEVLIIWVKLKKLKEGDAAKTIRYDNVIGIQAENDKSITLSLADDTYENFVEYDSIKITGKRTI